jgi:hypothetical protein
MIMVVSKLDGVVFEFEEGIYNKISQFFINLLFLLQQFDNTDVFVLLLFIIVDMLVVIFFFVFFFNLYNSKNCELPVRITLFILNVFMMLIDQHTY